MARSVITPQEIANSGIVPSYGAGNSVDGHSFVNDGNMFVHVKNGGGAPINVTLIVPAKVGGLTITNPVIAVTNGTEKMIGPFDPTLFNQATGIVYLDLSAATSVTLAVLRLP